MIALNNSHTTSHIFVNNPPDHNDLVVFSINWYNSGSDEWSLFFEVNRVSQFEKYLKASSVRTIGFSPPVPLGNLQRSTRGFKMTMKEAMEFIHELWSNVSVHSVSESKR